jgi:DNA-binding LacI/PurR family transcriptional regulator
LTNLKKSCILIETVQLKDTPMATIRDIARTAGVSVGTISNYLNNPELLADATRDRIQAAIDELGYYPKAAARALKSQLSKRVGIVPDTPSDINGEGDPGDAAFQEFLSAVNLVAAQHDFSLLLQASIDGQKELEIYRKLVGEGQVDGMLLLGTTPNDFRVKFLMEKNFPFVTFGRTSIPEHEQWVDIDGIMGMELAVDHLVSLGHQKIAWIPTPNDLFCYQHRQEGFRETMQKHGLSENPQYIVPGGFREVHGQVAMHLLLDLPQPPTAVITGNDFSAFGAMSAITQRGLQVGYDISVIGFDDIRMSAHWTPSLTTVKQSMRQIGAASMELLLEAIHGKTIQHRLLKPELVVRRSTGPVKA